MPRGQPLTPAQIEKAAEVYERTGNYSEAARAIGADVSATRRALLRSREPERAKLHARAAARGERLGRSIVEANLRRIDRILRENVDVPLEANKPPCLEPVDQGVYMREARLALRVLVALNDSLSTRRNRRLERHRLREEIKALRKKGAGPSDAQPLSPDDEAYLKLVAEKFGGPRQGLAHVKGKTGGDEPGT